LVSVNFENFEILENLDGVWTGPQLQSVPPLSHTALTIAHFELSVGFLKKKSPSGGLGREAHEFVKLLAKMSGENMSDNT
jgi:hypothetical protein